MYDKKGIWPVKAFVHQFEEDLNFVATCLVVGHDMWKIFCYFVLSFVSQGYRKPGVLESDTQRGRGVRKCMAILQVVADNSMKKTLEA